MKERRVELNVVHYNCLMDCFVSSGFVDSAHKVFDVMSGVKTDVFLYNIMITGYCKVGKVRDAVVKFEEMDELGLVPDK
ncbi:uncharacterized protein A4U43_C06F13180, partial [Asparagus officinalis]